MNYTSLRTAQTQVPTVDYYDDLSNILEINVLENITNSTLALRFMPLDTDLIYSQDQIYNLLEEIYREYYDPNNLPNLAKCTHIIETCPLDFIRYYFQFDIKTAAQHLNTTQYSLAKKFGLNSWPGNKFRCLFAKAHMQRTVQSYNLLITLLINPNIFTD